MCCVSGESSTFKAHKRVAPNASLWCFQVPSRRDAYRRFFTRISNAVSLIDVLQKSIWTNLAHLPKFRHDSSRATCWHESYIPKLLVIRNIQLQLILGHRSGQRLTRNDCVVTTGRSPNEMEHENMSTTHYGGSYQHRCMNST